MFISPMLLEKSDKPFNSSTHIFEPKIDGRRLILSRQNGETRLWTRHHTECTRQYPEFWEVPIDNDAVVAIGIPEPSISSSSLNGFNIGNKTKAEPLRYTD